MTLVKDIYNYIDSLAAYCKQEEWDNSGILVGDSQKNVKKAVMALDVTPDVCRFAAESGAELVVSHHPVIFSGAYKIPAGSAVHILAQHNISCLCAHTNYDSAAGGINDCLAAVLELKNSRHTQNPYIVTGELDCPMSIDDFVIYVNDKLSCSGIRYTDSDALIKTVAVGGGQCGDYIDDAMEISDCFVTGEAKYHQLLDASIKGFPVICAGHYETEYLPFLMLKSKLEKKFSDVEFIEAGQPNPVKSLQVNYGS